MAHVAEVEDKDTRERKRYLLLLKQEVRKSRPTKYSKQVPLSSLFLLHQG